MRGLIVPTHLPDHRLPVLIVVPECGDAPFSRNRGCIDADVIVAGTHNDLFAPVAEDVALIAGCGFRVVVGQRPR